MSLITTTHPQQAEGKTAEVYREIESKFGFIPNAIQLDSINPTHMARHWEGIKEAIAHESLSSKLVPLTRRHSDADARDERRRYRTGQILTRSGTPGREGASVAAVCDERYR